MPTHTRVLVVDGEGAEATGLRHLLSAAGYEISHAASADRALDQLERTGADVVLLALDLVGLEGVTRLAGVAGGAQLVLLVPAERHAEGRAALRLGALDLVYRADDIDAVLFAVERAAQEGLLRREVAMLRARVSDVASEALIGRSAAMTRVRELIGRAAASRMTVLVTGEPGTGKDVVARLVHDLSDRAGRPYVTVSCSGVDAEALEAELFGTPRDEIGGGGAGRGLFEEARGGTLVLDDVVGLPAALRTRLARVLAERSVRRVGAVDAVPVDVRLVLTARDQADGTSPLSGDDAIGRLNVLPIALPPLRERRSDVPQLVQHFRARLARETKAELPALANDAMMGLLGHQWPGNVRELEHWVERAAFTPGPTRLSAADTAPGGTAFGEHGDAPTLEVLERRYILYVLDQEDGHQSRAAERLGIDRRTLYRKLKQYRDEGVSFKQAI
jgi:DNA-binding NtrC family response regulator